MQDPRTDFSGGTVSTSSIRVSGMGERSRGQGSTPFPPIGSWNDPRQRRATFLVERMGYIDNNGVGVMEEDIYKGQIKSIVFLV